MKKKNKKKKTAQFFPMDLHSEKKKLKTKKKLFSVSLWTA
jgi:hypothetical protein